MSSYNSLNDDFFSYNYIRNECLKIDMIENDNSFIVKVDIPGVNRTDITVIINNSILKIKAERHNEFINNRIRIRERPHGYMSRHIEIPQNINENDINAKYRDGVLEIILPKLSNDTSNTHYINIE